MSGWFGFGLLVAVEGWGHGDGFVGSDRVVDRPVGVDFGGESETVSDFAAVEVFVFDGSEEPFDHPVGPGCLVPGTDVNDVTFGSHPGGGSGRFEARSVVGDDPQRPDLPGVGIGEVLDPKIPNRTSTSARAASKKTIASLVVLRMLTSQARLTLAQ